MTTYPTATAALAARDARRGEKVLSLNDGRIAVAAGKVLAELEAAGAVAGYYSTSFNRHSEQVVCFVPAADLLPPGCACPACGERLADALVWREDDSGVDCATCGHFYNPND